MDRVVLVKTVQDVEQMPHPFLSLTSGISASSPILPNSIYMMENQQKKLRNTMWVFNYEYSIYS